MKPELPPELEASADLLTVGKVARLAAVSADNAPRVGVGVSLGLPPTTPPDFRY